MTVVKSLNSVGLHNLGEVLRKIAKRINETTDPHRRIVIQEWKLFAGVDHDSNLLLLIHLGEIRQIQPLLDSIFTHDTPTSNYSTFSSKYGTGLANLVKEIVRIQIEINREKNDDWTWRLYHHPNSISNWLCIDMVRAVSDQTKIRITNLLQR